MFMLKKLKNQFYNSDVWTAKDSLSNYERKQCLLRECAWNYQNMQAEFSLSWGEYCEISAWFEKMGKRYGLLREFRENGIC